MRNCRKLNNNKVLTIRTVSYNFIQRNCLLNHFKIWIFVNNGSCVCIMHAHHRQIYTYSSERKTTETLQLILSANFFAIAVYKLKKVVKFQLLNSVIIERKWTKSKKASHIHQFNPSLQHNKWIFFLLHVFYILWQC